MEDARKVLAHNLKQLRGKETQERFAERAGIIYRTYQDMESGKVMPEFPNILRAATALNVPTARLFDDPERVAQGVGAELLRILARLHEDKVGLLLAAARGWLGKDQGAELQKDAR